MKSEFCENELKKMKVVDLQNMCKELNLEYKGLKKAELIECILKISNQDSDDSEKFEEIEEQVIDENISNPENEVVEDVECGETMVESVPQYIMVLDSHKMLFSRPDLAYPQTKIAGKIKILSQKGIFYEVETAINGRGIVHGYIVK